MKAKKNQRIRINARRATPEDVAKALDVSKKRLEELQRLIKKSS